MSLTKYKEKRNFQQTPEPEAESESVGKSRFVVQEHHATRLHFDFRMETGGVLKSWAVPKGPSMNPTDKRLAVMTEDHPVNYLTFEGTIPKGNYGAGQMYIWDTGTFALEKEKSYTKALEAGKVKFTLHGEKLQGTFQLVKLKNAEKNQWLLIKSSDGFSVETDYDATKISPGSSGPKNKPGPNARQKTAPSPSPGAALIAPMLARPGGEPFDDDNWIFEPKLDGYRAIAEVRQGAVKLYSRTGQPFEQTYLPIVEALLKLGHEAILDGEIVVLNKAGNPAFNLLQKYKKTKSGRLEYYVFDLLFLNGEDTTELPLVQRKQLLETLLGPLPGITYCQHFPGNGLDFFNLMKKEKMEGMMAKKADSTYTPGFRSSDWLKIKLTKTVDAIIGGFTEATDRREFGALLLGMFDEARQLQFTGHCGTGFNRQTIKDLRQQFEPLIVEKCPFEKKPQANAAVTWLKPELVCEVAFTEWTTLGVLRHPSFQRLRDEILPEDVAMPEARSAILASADAKPVAKPKKNSAMKNLPDEKKLRQEGKYSILKVGRNEVRLSSLDKVYFPKKGFTKGDVLDYYIQMADYILPYLKDRPESLRRTPEGAAGDKDFFQKDINFTLPGFAKTAPFYSESAEKEIDWLVCNNLETLLFMVNLGTIEINPWNSRTQKPTHPDYAAIDLDPGPKTDFGQVVETCLAAKEILDEANIPGYCKTSGGRGLHIFIPLGGKYDYGQARDFVKSIMMLVHHRLPKITSLERSPSARKAQIYLDYLQNKQGQTLVAPYSVRPREFATVSTPLDWREVNERLKITDFDLKTVPERVKKIGDLWKPVLGKGLDMEKAIEKMLAGA